MSTNDKKPNFPPIFPILYHSFDEIPPGNSKKAVVIGLLNYIYTVLLTIANLGGVIWVSVSFEILSSIINIIVAAGLAVLVPFAYFITEYLAIYKACRYSASPSSVLVLFLFLFLDLAWNVYMSVGWIGSCGAWVLADVIQSSFGSSETDLLILVSVITGLWLCNTLWLLSIAWFVYRNLSSQIKQGAAAMNRSSVSTQKDSENVSQVSSPLEFTTYPSAPDSSDMFWGSNHGPNYSQSNGINEHKLSASNAI